MITLDKKMSKNDISNMISILGDRFQIKELNIRIENPLYLKNKPEKSIKNQSDEPESEQLIPRKKKLYDGNLRLIPTDQIDSKLKNTKDLPNKPVKSDNNSNPLVENREVESKLLGESSKSSKSRV